MGIIKNLINMARHPTNFLRDYVGTVLYRYGLTTSGKYVTPYNAMQMTAVYACVRIIAETVASLPLNIYRYTDDGKIKDYKHP